MDRTSTDRWTSAAQDILAFIDPELNLNTAEETLSATIRLLLDGNTTFKDLWDRLCETGPHEELDSKGVMRTRDRWKMAIATTAVQISLSYWNGRHTVDLERCWAACESDLHTTVVQAWSRTILRMMMLVLMIGYSQQQSVPESLSPGAATDRNVAEFLMLDAVREFRNEAQELTSRESSRNQQIMTVERALSRYYDQIYAFQELWYTSQHSDSQHPTETSLTAEIERLKASIDQKESDIVRAEEAREEEERKREQERRKLETDVFNREKEIGNLSGELKEIRQLRRRDMEAHKRCRDTISSLRADLKKTESGTEIALKACRVEKEELEQRLHTSEKKRASLTQRLSSAVTELHEERESGLSLDIQASKLEESLADAKRNAISQAQVIERYEAKIHELGERLEACQLFEVPFSYDGDSEAPVTAAGKHKRMGGLGELTNLEGVLQLGQLTSFKDNPSKRTLDAEVQTEDFNQQYQPPAFNRVTRTASSPAFAVENHQVESTEVTACYSSPVNEFADFLISTGIFEARNARILWRGRIPQCIIC
ncbi:hypothetical protein PQX77_001410 [Marasmius sp. AFHP31]|nr:hypothetical protein PQX77_001410 [Marasmius sp. AFHP31]